MLARRKLLVAGLSSASLLTLGGCGARTSARRAALRFRYASPYALSHPYSRADITWMAEVARRSAGQIALQPFWGGALIGDTDSVRELGHGVADASYVMPIYTRAGSHLIRGQAAFYQGTSTMPEQEAVFARLWQEFEPLRNEMPGVQMLLATGGTPLQIMTGKRPITRLADLAGLRLRTPAELAPVLNQFGVDAEFMTMGEVYTAISKGTIDGLAAPVDVLKAMRLAEVVNHCYLLDIPRGAYPSRAFNLTRFRALPEAARATIVDSLPIWQQAMRTEVAKAVDAGVQFGRDKGVLFHEPEAKDRDDFSAIYKQQALARARELDARGLPGSAMFARVQAIIAQMRV
jgi:TRAP-type C4-dicarboxylate transport system substrate-binding protein